MPTKDMKVDWLEDLFIESYSITIQDLLERLSKHKNNGYSQFYIASGEGYDEHSLNLYGYRKETEKERITREKRSEACRLAAKKRHKAHIQKERDNLPKKIEKLSKALEKAKERLNKVLEKNT